MRLRRFLSLIIDYISSFFIIVREGYRIKDRLTLLEYYSKTPFYFVNFIFGRKNKRILARDVLIKNKYGLFFCGRNFSNVYGLSSMSEPEVRKKVFLDEGDAIDVGANCGMYTIPLARMLKNKGKVMSIEPEKKNIEILKRNIYLNKLDNIIVIEGGCFSKKGKMELFLDPVGAGGHSLLKNNSKRRELILVDTIDNLVKENKLKKVNLIKIDVEGVEAEVLEGAKKTLKKYHPKIVFEAWNIDYLYKIKNILDEFGYNLKKISDQNYLAI